MKTIFFSGWSFSVPYLKTSFNNAGICLDDIIIVDSTSLLHNFNQQIDQDDCLHELCSKIKNNYPISNEELILIGWSIGGLIATIFAAESSLKISKLTLVNSTSNFIANIEERKQALYKLRLGISSLDTQAEYLGKFYHSLLKEVGTWRVNIKPTTADLTTQGLTFDPKTLTSSLDFLEKIDTLQILSSLNLPFEIITSENDLLIPPIHSQIISKALKDGRVKIIPNQGHLLPLAAPDQIFK